ncbi:MAG: amidohydrolase, partial [Gemmatimonas sp.]
MDAPVVITNVTVIPMTSATTVLSGQTVVINNGLVSFIGTANAPIPAGAITVDGTGKFLLPGYNDMHGHFTRREELFLYLANGITTLRNMAGYAWQ